MSTKRCQIKVRILSVSPIVDYRGPILTAGGRPRFAVALILEDRASIFEDKDSGVSFPIDSVVVFAVDSIVKLFMEKEIVGNQYVLHVRMETINEKKLFFLDRA
jgi:hypothetical protein